LPLSLSLAIPCFDLSRRPSPTVQSSTFQDLIRVPKRANHRPTGEVMPGMEPRLAPVMNESLSWIWRLIPLTGRELGYRGMPLSWDVAGPWKRSGACDSTVAAQMRIIVPMAGNVRPASKGNSIPMRKLILSVAILVSPLMLTGCEYVGLFDSSIKPEVTGNGPKEPGGVAKTPEVNKEHHDTAKEHSK
jgi:hypothetical protein